MTNIMQAAPVQQRTTDSPAVSVAIYLADQNPQRDRSLGITSMTRSLLSNFKDRDDLKITQIISRSSFRSDDAAIQTKCLPFRTDSPLGRLYADAAHHFMVRPPVDLWYYPKGYVSRFSGASMPKIGTMHDTIVQYYADNYPETRSPRAFNYWIDSTKRSLRKFDRVLTVSQHAAEQLRLFCDRHSIQTPIIDVTYEGSNWETLRGTSHAKKDSVIHLAATAPHKGTNTLLQHWKVLQDRGVELPELTLVGKLDSTGHQIIDSLNRVVKRDSEQTDQLQRSIAESRALLLPSKIEGFGLPALEAYYVGTPVCFVGGTSVAEVVDPSGHAGSFAADDVDDFQTSLDWALSIRSDQVESISQAMHERFSTSLIADRVVSAFRQTIK